jgi:DNA-binding transcriptional regulator GbsR (MarR family)
MEKKIIAVVIGKEQMAPLKQLLIDANNITEVANRIIVKKSDIPDPNLVNILRNLCKAKQTPEVTMTKFLVRKAIVENASQLYAEKGLDDDFDQSVLEIEVIEEILKQYSK